MQRLTVVFLIVALIVAGCGSGERQPELEASASGAPTSFDEQPVRAAVASYDIAVGDDRRFTAGLVLADAGVLVGGEVTMELFYFGETDEQDDAELQRGLGASIQSRTASFLAVPGLEPEERLDEPQPGDGTVVGVYETTFDFDRPGRYGIGIIADVDGEVLQGTTVFDVAAESAIPGVGDEAPLAPNPTLDDDVPLEVIDSRAQDGAEVPDPRLHQTTLAQSIEAGNRAVVLLSTPVYCVSRFCGPITEQVEVLADEVPEGVDVIHIEVWEDFEAQQLHPAAAQWIQTETGGNEPWLFVVDDDGTVLGRWDNVADLAAVRELLARS